MRPINLIPKDQRQGARKPGGPLGYVLIGALVLLLAGVALMVSTDNQISTSKGEVTELETENTAAEAKVAKLRGVEQDQRVFCISALASADPQP